jgi:hypothetical protein
MIIPGLDKSGYPAQFVRCALFAQTCTLRTRQRHGFDFSSEFSTSPLRVAAILALNKFS